MASRWFFLAVVGIALFTYMNRADDSGAVSATITQSCSAAVAGGATVTLAWPAPEPTAQETWLDVSLDRAFPPGATQAHGPLAPSQTAYALDGLPDGLRLFYRVNALAPEGWARVVVGSFIAECGD